MATISSTQISLVQIGNNQYKLVDRDLRERVSILEASGLIFKGTVSTAAGITGLTNYKTGWCYLANASFTITNVGTVENGDMIICIGDYDSTLGWSALDWSVVQNNVDVFSTTVKGLVPAPGSEHSDTRYVLSATGWREDYASAILQHSATLVAANWSGNSAPYTYQLQMLLHCGDGTMRPIIYPVSNTEEYSLITNAEVLSGGIIFTSNSKPSNDIEIIVEDIVLSMPVYDGTIATS